MESEEINAAPVTITGGLVSLEEEIYKHRRKWFVEVEWLLVAVIIFFTVKDKKFRKALDAKEV